MTQLSLPSSLHTQTIKQRIMSDTPTDKYKHFNHHHEMTDAHEVVDFGEGEFIANKEAIPLLAALNNAGLKTRTHHHEGTGHSFVSILLDNVSVEVRKVWEVHSTRDKYNGQYELLINWKTKTHD